MTDRAKRFSEERVIQQRALQGLNASLTDLTGPESVSVWLADSVGGWSQRSDDFILTPAVYLGHHWIPVSYQVHVMESDFRSFQVLNVKKLNFFRNAYMI